jgi:hypothetical protein
VTPFFLGVIVVGVAIIALGGALRRDGALIVAMTAGGWLIVMLAAMSVWDLGSDATGAVFLGALGGSLVTMGIERRRRDTSSDGREPVRRPGR